MQTNSQCTIRDGFMNETDHEALEDKLNNFNVRKVSMLYQMMKLPNPSTTVKADAITKIMDEVKKFQRNEK